MPSFASIAPDKLARLIGTPKAPLVIDVRDTEDAAADPRLIPTSLHLPYAEAEAWASKLAGKSVAVSCQRGKKLAEGAAAWLRHYGAEAEVVEGGFVAWREAGLPLVPAASIPKRSATGATVWVTRSRPKIDRVACPWLIRRFVDPQAVFLFVAPAEVNAVADRFNATPFDVEGVFWSHRDELCTFDVMVQEFGLASPALDRLAVMVRAADTDRLDLAPQAAGLLAVSLGLSRMYGDDLEQLEAAMLIYDALFRWARDATEETHSWPAAGRSAK
jgi:rhodanese-related sulfurtransferase